MSERKLVTAAHCVHAYLTMRELHTEVVGFLEDCLAVLIYHGVKIVAINVFSIIVTIGAGVWQAVDFCRYLYVTI